MIYHVKSNIRLLYIYMQYIQFRLFTGKKATSSPQDHIEIISNSNQEPQKNLVVIANQFNIERVGNGTVTIPL